MTKHHLTLRPNYVGDTKVQDDYLVRRDLRRVGRIHLVSEALATDPVWEWGLNVPLPTPWWCIGRTSSLEEAKIAFLDAWKRFYDSLSPEQIAHWQEQQDAASERANRLSERSATDAQAQSDGAPKAIPDGREPL